MDHRALRGCLEVGSLAELKKRHAEWVEEALAADRAARDERWTAAVAVGNRGYVDHVKGPGALGTRATGGAGRRYCVGPRGDQERSGRTAV